MRGRMVGFVRIERQKERNGRRKRGKREGEAREKQGREWARGKEKEKWKPVFERTPSASR